MEKRWTRKKRALRDAGGPEPKPALTGALRLAGDAEESSRDASAAADVVRREEVSEAPKRSEATAEKPAETPAGEATDEAPAGGGVSPRRVARVRVAEPTHEPTEKTAETPPAAPEPVAENTEPEPKPKAKKSRKLKIKRKPITTHPGPEDAPEPEPKVAIVPSPAEDPVPTPEPEPEVALTPALVPEAAPVPEPEQEQEAAPISSPVSEAAPEPGPEAEPAPTATLDPEPASKAAPESDPEPDPEPARAQSPSNLAVLARKPGGSKAWDKLPTFPINARKLERNRIITATREDPVHSAFDVLRTKLLRALRENGWTRVAVTSPTEGCGKTFLAANLAISLSRQSNCRSILMDLDMRHPGLARALDIAQPPDLPSFLRGNLPMEDLFCRPAENSFKIGDQVAFGVNGQREPYAAELLQDPDTADVLDAMEAALSPDVILFDMPPALANDDVLAARPLFDGIILVVGGGITKPQQVRDVERRLGTETPLLGMVLNRAEDEAAQIYGY